MSTATSVTAALLPFVSFLSDTAILTICRRCFYLLRVIAILVTPRSYDWTRFRRMTKLRFFKIILFEAVEGGEALLDGLLLAIRGTPDIPKFRRSTKKAQSLPLSEEVQVVA